MASRLFSTLLLGLSLIDAISAHPSASHRLSVNRGPCFTDHPTFTKDLLKRNPHLGPGKGLEKRLKTEPINLDVWFHVIRKDDSIAGGNIPQERLDAQFAILKKSLASLDVHPKLIGTTRHLNTRWFNYNGPDLDMTRVVRKGNFRTLNIYFVGDFGGGSTHPFGTPESLPGIPVPEFPTADQQAYDGVWIDHRTVPGGPGPGAGRQGEGWNMGKTAVHEVGHWLSLYHPFGWCGNEPDDGTSGDYVADTPPAAEPYFWCRDDPRYIAIKEAGIFNPDDSCEQWPGEDLHENPMSYFDDRCKYDHFTEGQKERVHLMWPKIRGKYPAIQW